MILFLALQAAAATPAAPDPRARNERCAALAIVAPGEAMAEAGAWRVAGGGFQAQQCMGLAYASRKRWAPAAGAFETAAREAEIANDARAATYWAQAGNAWLAGDEPAKARAALDAAIALNTLEGQALGLAQLDRARALVAAGDLAGARGSFDAGVKLAPDDPLGWLMSAQLARRAGDLPRAQADIKEALARGGDDALVRLEAGNVAAAAGDEAGARREWNAAIVAAPTSPMATSAKAALAQFDAEPPVQPAVPAGR